MSGWFVLPQSSELLYESPSSPPPPHPQPYSHPLCILASTGLLEEHFSVYDLRPVLHQTCFFPFPVCLLEVHKQLQSVLERPMCCCQTLILWQTSSDFPFPVCLLEVHKQLQSVLDRPVCCCQTLILWQTSANFPNAVSWKLLRAMMAPSGRNLPVWSIIINDSHNMILSS